VVLLLPAIFHRRMRSTLPDLQLGSWRMYFNLLLPLLLAASLGALATDLALSENGINDVLSIFDDKYELDYALMMRLGVGLAIICFLYVVALWRWPLYLLCVALLATAGQVSGPFYVIAWLEKGFMHVFKRRTA
jgi:hypothetical protein